MGEVPSISGAELEVMRVLWDVERPMKVQEVADRLKSSGWMYNTVATLLNRLAEKGAVKVQKGGRANLYTAAADKEEYKKDRTKTLVAKLYNGSAKELAVSLFKNGDLSQSDIDEIRQMFKL